MQNKKTSMLYMFIWMFLIQYFFASYIMTHSIENITFSVGKIYMCIIMGLFMILLDIIISHNHMNKLIVIGLILFFIYLYRNQYGIDEKNYIREMIEHHSMAVLTSKNILEKTENPAVIDFATKILVGQENEIADMQNLLKSI